MKHTPDNDAMERRIREMADSLKIPPSLEPENLLPRLPDRQRIPIIRIRRYLPAAAAAACLLVVLSGTVFLRQFAGPSVITPESSLQSSGPESSAPESSASPSLPGEVSAESEDEAPSGEASGEPGTDALPAPAPEPSQPQQSAPSGGQTEGPASSAPEETPSEPQQEPENSLQQQDVSAYQDVYDAMVSLQRDSQVYSGAAPAYSRAGAAVAMSDSVSGAGTVQSAGSLLCSLSSGEESETITVFNLRKSTEEPASVFQPEFQVPEFEGMHLSSIAVNELYLKGTTLAAVGTAYYWSDAGTRQRTITVISLYDLSSPQKPEYLVTLAQDGQLAASCLDGSTLALVTSYTVSPRQTLEEDRLASYLPVCYVNGREVLPTGEQIQVSPDADSPTYTFISTINLREPEEFQDVFSYLGEGSSFYLTSGQIYMMHDGRSSLNLTAFTYGRSIRLKSETQLEGQLMGQLFMDPRERALRVSVLTEENSVSLYLFDKDLELLGAMENFVPASSVSKVWYREYFAYYYDSAGNPLCMVDCSVPASPQFLEGDPQAEWGDLYAFGSNAVGIEPAYGEDGTYLGIRVSLYKEEMPAGFSLTDEILLEGSWSLTGWEVPDNIFLDPDNGLIGLSLTMQEDGSIRYLLLSCSKDKGFSLLLDHPVEMGENLYLDYRTGVYSGGTFYLATPGKLEAFSAAELKRNAASE